VKSRIKGHGFGDVVPVISEIPQEREARNKTETNSMTGDLFVIIGSNSTFDSYNNWDERTNCWDSMSLKLPAQ